MNILKAVLQNYLLSFDFVKTKAQKFYNTGGGSINSITYKKRAIENSDLIISKCNLNNIKPKRILEIGYGISTKCLELLNQYYLPEVIYGVEKINYNNSSSVTTFQSINDIPSSAKFDLIYTVDVLEHVAYPKELLKTISSRIDESGLIIHSVDLTSHYHKKNQEDAFKHYIYKSRSLTF